MDVGHVSHGRAALEAVRPRVMQQEQATREGTSDLGRPPLLAARVGPAPVREADAVSDDILRATLRERARLVDLGPVLQEPASKTEDSRRDAADSRSGASERDPEQMPAPLGEPRAETTREKPAPREPFRAEAGRSAPAADHEPGERETSERGEEQRTSATQQREPEAEALAGALLTPRGAALREAGASRSRRDPEAAAASGDTAGVGRSEARARFSQSGAVDAESPDDLVARFARGARQA